MIFSSLDALVPFAKLRAQRGTYNGDVSTVANEQYVVGLCTHRFADWRAGKAASIIFTRDVGHHSQGWWKNPDYERCFHLSIAMRDPTTGMPIGYDRSFYQVLVEAFFDRDARLCWGEPPYSPEGQRFSVWHYRLFCDLAWQPIMPRGEVYDRTLTEAGWKSFSEIHGVALSEVEAPFLKEGQ